MKLTIDDFKKHFSGDVILPGDTAYEQAGTTFVRQGRPALIVRPCTTSDIKVAIRYATEHNLVMSVRSGGHSGSGHSTNDGGIVIDVSPINDVTIIDKDRRTVRIGAGANWGVVAKTLQRHHLAISSGDTNSVGVGGLTLGGGIGWMVRKYGLAIDSLVAAEVVLHDGTLVRASETEHADLFWALRGGGGNFGVVVHFEFTAQPADMVWSGMISFAMDDLPALLRAWRDYMRVAPDDLTTMFLVMPSFAGSPPAALVTVCYAGDDKAVFDRLLGLGNVVMSDIKQIPYSDVLAEPRPPKGVKILTNNVFIQDFSDDTIAMIVTEYKDNNVMVQIRSLGGAMNRIDADATAFYHRDSEVLVVSPTFLPPDSSAADVNQALEPWRRIAGLGRGAYVNFFSSVDRTGELANAYPPDVQMRLAKIKKIYDPNNVFNQNHNITPAA